MKILIVLLFTLLTFSLKAKASDPIILINHLATTEIELETIVLEKTDPIGNINFNLENFNHLIAIFNNFKSYDINFANSLALKVQNRDTLSGDELILLRRMMTTYYKINQRIVDFSMIYDFGGFELTTKLINIDKHTDIIKAHLIWLSGHLLLIDHLEIMHEILFEKDGNLRRIVKNALLDKRTNAEGSTKTINDLVKLDEYSLEIAQGKKFAQRIILVRQTYSDIKESLSGDLEATALLDEVNNNQTSIEIAKGKTQFHISTFRFIDQVIGVFDKTMGWLSKVFGNIAGSITSRKGHLLKNEEALIATKKQLRPMDILFDKSPFVLTDKFIPGYYDHVALYLGTKEQLIELGMWEHPAVVGYQEDIENGKVILEAVRTGVRLTSLEDFMNVDEILITRKSDVYENMTLLKESIARGLNQIGKSYDFNFDISTLDKIVCSELLYIVFGNVHWPTEYRLGRPTISPDNIAEILFFKESKFKMQTYVLSRNDRLIEINRDLNNVAEKLNYELRTIDGRPLENIADASNSYWKRVTKCHTESVVNPNQNPEYSSQRVCETSYLSFQYVEQYL